MRRILPLALLFVPFLAPHGVGSPIDSEAIETKKFEFTQPWVKTLKFRGGERASVIAVGLRRGEGSTLRIAVHQVDGKEDTLIAEDAGSGIAGDCVAVIWYPPRDGEYRITVSNPHGAPASCYITVK